MFSFQLFPHVLRAVLAGLYFHVLSRMCFLVQRLRWTLTKPKDYYQSEFSIASYYKESLIFLAYKFFILVTF